LSTPPIQVHRFASPELSDTVNGLWRTGIENPEVRDLLLQIIGAGKLTVCADTGTSGSETTRITKDRIRPISVITRKVAGTPS
jgi:hypothetical protein